MRRAKRFLATVLCVVLMSSIVICPVYAFDSALECANALFDLGLFYGTDNGYELDRQPTRVEGIVMFVRLLGAEKDVKEKQYEHPFSDVPEWANSYVGYAFENKLTNGISEDLFGSQTLLTLRQYLVFILRALGYREADGDFDWDTVETKAQSLGLLPSNLSDRGQTFTRGTVVILSWNALTQCKKDSTYTLTNSLVDKGAFSKEKAIQYGLWSDAQGTGASYYTAAVNESKKNINDLLSFQPTDIDALKIEYTYLLNLYIREYCYKALAYGAYTGDYKTDKFNDLLDKCAGIDSEMKQYFDPEEVDVIYAALATSAYYSYAMDEYFSERDLIGSKDNPDVDAMWEALVKDRVISGIGLGFGEVELPEG